MILRYIAEPGCEPSYGNDRAAGIDLRAAEDAELRPLVPTKIRTGIRVEIPRHHVGLVSGRSGWAFGSLVWGFEGKLDDDFRGEVAVQLLSFFYNPLRSTVNIHRGDRIGQLVVVPVVRCELVAATELSATDRGDKGFGSTGVK